MAKGIANEVKEATFLEIRVHNILSRFDGESEANLEAVFQLAKILAPTIIFIGKLSMETNAWGHFYKTFYT